MRALIATAAAAALAVPAAALAWLWLDRELAGGLVGMNLDENGDYYA